MFKVEDVLTDLDRDGLLAYRSSLADPADFDDFWSGTLAEARGHDLRPLLTPVSSPVRTLEVFDVEFTGFGGDRIRGWLRVPRERPAILPGLVEFLGYGGGRGRPEETLLWASAGYAHLVMDTRGQGSGWNVGATADPHGSGPQIPGFMTKGILDRNEYYYRRLFTDAVRAVDVLAGVDGVDADRIGVFGGSQGGGISLAAAGLSPVVKAVAAWVPFLCDFPRSTMRTDEHPYFEITRYLAARREERDAVFRTLQYFDGVNFARRATAPARISVALMDPICPPSGVMGAYHAYAGPKELDMWDFNRHEGGAIEDHLAALRHFDEVLGR